MLESEIQNKIKLEASQKKMRLWRNNNGVAFSKDGTPIRFGLANESKKVNEVLKSSDLIGIKPIVITQDMVGKTIGQFVCREVKNSEWKYSGTKREQAQLNWINLINSLGGDAAFATSEGTL